MSPFVTGAGAAVLAHAGGKVSSLEESHANGSNAAQPFPLLVQDDSADLHLSASDCRHLVRACSKHASGRQKPKYAMAPGVQDDKEATQSSVVEVYGNRRYVDVKGSCRCGHGSRCGWCRQDPTRADALSRAQLCHGKLGKHSIHAPDGTQVAAPQPSLKEPAPIRCIASSRHAMHSPSTLSLQKMLIQDPLSTGGATGVQEGMQGKT